MKTDLEKMSREELVEMILKLNEDKTEPLNWTDWSFPGNTEMMGSILPAVIDSRRSSEIHKGPW